MADFTANLAHRPAASSLIAAFRPAPADETERKDLAQSVHDAKQSLLESKISLGGQKVSELDLEIQSTPPQIVCKANPQVEILKAQKAEQEVIIAEATKELAALKQKDPAADNRSLQSLKNEMNQIKLGVAELTKDKEQLDNKKLDRELRIELAKPEHLPPQNCNRGYVGVQPSVRDQSKIDSLKAQQLKNNSEILEPAMKEIKDLQEQMATQVSGASLSGSARKKSKAAADSLSETFKSLSSRAGILSLEELSKIQTTLGEALPYLKNITSGSAAAKLKESLATLNPAMRNQLNDKLGIDTVLVNADNSHNSLGANLVSGGVVDSGTLTANISNRLNGRSHANNDASRLFASSTLGVSV